MIKIIPVYVSYKNYAVLDCQGLGTNATEEEHNTCCQKAGYSVWMEDHCSLCNEGASCNNSSECKSVVHNGNTVEQCCELDEFSGSNRCTPCDQKDKESNLEESPEK